MVAKAFQKLSYLLSLVMTYVGLEKKWKNWLISVLISCVPVKYLLQMWLAQILISVS
jgi:hypothetical protein